MTPLIESFNYLVLNYLVSVWSSIKWRPKAPCGRPLEIDALSPLIAQLDSTDAVVTIDAIGCQKELVEQIQPQQGHYLLAVNANRGTLSEENIMRLPRLLHSL